MARNQAEEDLGCESPCQCIVLGCCTGRAAGAGSSHGTGEEGAGSAPQRLPSLLLPVGICEGISPQDAGWALQQPLYHQLVSRWGEQLGDRSGGSWSALGLLAGGGIPALVGQRCARC